MTPFDSDLVTGSVPRSVWKLAWPAIGLNLINGTHGFVDHLLVGNILGYEANAAIGASWLLFLVVVVFIASLFHGASVLVARYAGRQDREMLSRVVYETLLVSVFVLFAVVAPAGYFAAPYMLRLVNAEPAVLAHALPYLRIMFTLGAPLFLQFLLNYTMQASGDARTPLLLGVINTALNIVLSYVLITGLGPAPALGAAGAAIATCMAPLAGISIAVWLIVRRRTIIQIPAVRPRIPSWEVLRVVLRIGLPTGLQAVLLNIGGVLLLRKIGGLPASAEAQAVYTIGYAQLFALVTWAAFGLRTAAATIMGQNIGAGQPRRGRRGVCLAVALGVVWAVLLGSVYWFFPVQLLALFDARDPALVALGTHLLRVLAWTGMFLAATLALTGGLQGAGETRKPMVIAFISQILVLLGLVYGMDWIGLLTPQRVWLSILAAQASRFAMTAWIFWRGDYIQDVAIRE